MKKRSLIPMAMTGLLLAGFALGRHLHTSGVANRPHVHALSDLLAAGDASGIGESATGGPDDNGTPPEEIFDQTLDHVRREYVGNYGSDARLTNGALARMFAALDDPRTVFLDPTLRQARQDALEGTWHGIGAALTVIQIRQQGSEYRYLTVVDAMPGSPAEKAGMVTGDRIVAINHHEIAFSASDPDRLISTAANGSGPKSDASQEAGVKPYAPAKALTLLTTGKGRTLTLTLNRPGQPGDFTRQVTTTTTEIDPVNYKLLDGGAVYLRIRQFNSEAMGAMEAVLNKADKNANRLVLDLRGNPGGARGDGSSRTRSIDGYACVQKLIERLAPGKAVAQIESRPRKRTVLTSAASVAPLRVRLAVLVDSGTAGLAELAAAALRDGAQAKLIGTHTFGDDVLPLFSVFRNGSGVEMRSGRMLRADGTDLSRGLEPDIVVADGNTDTILKRALADLIPESKS